MEQGIVPGGGIALFNVVAKAVERKGESVADEAHRILMNSLTAPLAAIITNSGENPSAIMKKLADKKNAGEDIWSGFNAKTNEYVNLKEAGIIDPLKVTKTALQNAVSVASNYLMTGAAMIELPKPESPQMPGGGMGMM